MKRLKRELLETVAVIYCRVSSSSQMQGHGIDSQETRCREFARARGYRVEKVFKDEAVSGRLTDRPGMNAMLAHMRDGQRARQYVCLLDDISRLARSMRAHLELRAAIAATGARLESPSVEFGDNSDAMLIENLLASVSGHQRDKIVETTHNRQQARMQAGYWPFAAPYGFKHKGGSESGLLVRREPVASIVQEALEGFAYGRFQSQAEVKRFLESQPGITKSKEGYVSHTLVPKLLTNPIYAGYVQLQNDDWDVPLRKGAHKGLIDFETFERIQAILKGSNRAPVRADLSEDFPLRGAVSCAHCGNSLTACWSTSKTGVKHPYYMCFNKACDRSRKSIPRARIEGEFVRLLEGLAPSPKLLAMSHAMFTDAWEQRGSQRDAIKLAYDRELQSVNREIDRLLDRIVDASDTVAKAYERRIDQLEREKVLLRRWRNRANQSAHSTKRSNSHSNLSPIP